MLGAGITMCHRAVIGIIEGIALVCEVQCMEGLYYHVFVGDYPIFQAPTFPCRLAKRIEMKLNDDWNKKIELAGLKGNPGMEKLAKYAPILKNANLLQRVERMLDLRSALAEDSHPFPSPDDETVAEGEILLGTVVRMDGSLGPQVYLPIGIMDRYPHIMMSGAAGTGKSTNLRCLIRQYTQERVGSLLLDTEDEYSNLLAYLPEGRCWVFDDKTFKRNPLQPLAREDRRRTFGRLKRVFRETFLRDGSINLLGEELINIMDSIGQEQTLHSLFGQLGRARYRLDSRRGQYLESLKNRLGNVVEFVDIYDCIEGFDIRDWLGPRCIVMRLDALSDELKDFVVNEIIACIQDWTQQNPNLGLKLVIGIDEAHRFFSPGKAARYDLGDPILLDSTRTFRKRGVNLILSTQVFSDLPVAALANISTFLVFRTSEGSCIRAVGQALSLNREQMEYLPKLGERRAVLKHPLIPEPFIIEVPELDFSRVVSEDEIKERMAPVIGHLKWVPRTRDETSASSTGGALAGLVAGAEVQEQRNHHKGKGLAPVAKEELDYMEAIARDPFIPATERDKRLGLTAYKGNKIRNDLCKRELVKMHQIQTGKRGKPIVLIEITTRGWQILESYKMNVQKPKGKGGFIHQFWQHKVQQWYQEHYPGCKPMIEQLIDGKAVDVGVEIDGKRVSVEILIQGEQKEQTNIHRDIAVGFDEVIICCEDQETIERLKKRLMDTFGDTYINRVRFKELKEFMA